MARGSAGRRAGRPRLNGNGRSLPCSAADGFDAEACRCRKTRGSPPAGRLVESRIDPEAALPGGSGLGSRDDGAPGAPGARRAGRPAHGRAWSR